MSFAWVAFLVFAFSQVGTPGPANMALLATGARFGLRAALPFVAGVALGKQFVIWPVGFGLMGLAQSVPWLFVALKWVSAAYILWLAWRVANMRLAPGDGPAVPPGFAAGLLVHPLNPKAWAMVVAAFTQFSQPGTPALQVTAAVAICLLVTQAVLHPLWAWGGDRIARLVSGAPAERYLMWTLAAATVASVIYVLFSGGSNGN
ncbi:MAG: LysE family translocator [Pseudomonadota bacterium]